MVCHAAYDVTMQTEIYALGMEEVRNKYAAAAAQAVSHK